MPSQKDAEEITNALSAARDALWLAAKALAGRRGKGASLRTIHAKELDGAARRINEWITEGGPNWYEWERVAVEQFAQELAEAKAHVGQGLNLKKLAILRNWSPAKLRRVEARLNITTKGTK